MLWSLRPRGRDLKADAHVSDHLGSTMEVVECDGDIESWYRYDPFGMYDGRSETLLSSYKCTSPVQDDVTQLYFMGARV